jgi:hypothetical protein
MSKSSVGALGLAVVCLLSILVAAHGQAVEKTNKKERSSKFGESKSRPEAKGEIGKQNKEQLSKFGESKSRSETKGEIGKQNKDQLSKFGESKSRPETKGEIGKQNKDQLSKFGESKSPLDKQRLSPDAQKRFGGEMKVPSAATAPHSELSSQKAH